MITFRLKNGKRGCLYMLWINHKRNIHVSRQLFGVASAKKRVDKIMMPVAHYNYISKAVLTYPVQAIVNAGAFYVPVIYLVVIGFAYYVAQKFVNYFLVTRFMINFVG